MTQPVLQMFRNRICELCTTRSPQSHDEDAQCATERAGMQQTSPGRQIQSVQTAAAHLSVQHELGMQEEMIVALWAVPAACTGLDRPKPKRPRQPRAGSAKPPQQLDESWEVAGSQGS